MDSDELEELEESLKKLGQFCRKSCFVCSRPANSGSGNMEVGVMRNVRMVERRKGETFSPEKKVEVVHKVTFATACVVLNPRSQKEDQRSRI